MEHLGLIHPSILSRKDYGLRLKFTNLYNIWMFQNLLERFKEKINILKASCVVLLGEELATGEDG